MLLSHCLSLLFLAATASASPVGFDPHPEIRDGNGGTDNGPGNGGSDTTDPNDSATGSIKKDFRGIHWDVAEKECREDDFNVLAGTARGALEMTNFHMEDPMRSPAWNRYFQGGAAIGEWKKKGSNADMMSRILSNMHQVATYPRLGRPINGEYKKTKQVTYRCRESYGLNKCAGPPLPGESRWRGPLAYTIDPSRSGAGWEIVFCRRFFDDPWNNRPAKFKADNFSLRKPTEIVRLATWEHVMIHEWMHTSIFGISPKVVDVLGTVKQVDGEISIYGDTRSWQFAWRDAPSINIHTGMNADTYAWFFTYNYFHNRWGWTSDGNFDPTGVVNKRRIGVTDPEGDYILYPDMGEPATASELSLPKDPGYAINVYTKPDAPGRLLVDYIGDDYDTYEQELEKPFMSFNSNCLLTAACKEASKASESDTCSCLCGMFMVDPNIGSCLGHSGDETTQSLPLP